MKTARAMPAAVLSLITGETSQLHTTTGGRLLPAPGTLSLEYYGDNGTVLYRRIVRYSDSVKPKPFFDWEPCFPDGTRIKRCPTLIEAKAACVTFAGTTKFHDSAFPVPGDAERA